MDKNKKSLIILSGIMAVVWLSLLVVQIRMTNRVFRGYKEVFQNKLDEAVDRALLDFDRNDHGTGLDYGMLDSLLACAFHANGIDDPFEMGLFSTEDDDFHFLTEETDRNKILKYGFVFTVSNDHAKVNQVGDKLYVYFTNFQKLFLRDAIPSYVVIVMLLLVLLYCFIVFVVIVIRQRKLNDFRLHMLNNITHELKTPVTTINLAAQLLQDKTVLKDEESSREYLTMITDEADSILQMVDEVLTVFRVEQKPTGERVEVSIHSMLKKVVDIHQIRLQQCNAEVCLDLQAERDVVMGDPNHLSNGFSNLIDNAIKYRNGDLKITVSTKVVGDNIEIRVADNGIGISKEDQQLIFEPFARVNTENEHYVKGYGLGLHYVNQIINYHKGSIKVESELGKGATFVVYLPLKF